MVETVKEEADAEMDEEKVEAVVVGWMDMEDM